MSSKNNSSSGNPRKWFLQVTFTESERRLLQSIAAKDKREEGPEVKWLVEAYAKGELVTKTELSERGQELINRIRQSDVVLTEAFMGLSEKLEDFIDSHETTTQPQGPPNLVVKTLPPILVRGDRKEKSNQK
jgi:hypothetical protein